VRNEEYGEALILLKSMHQFVKLFLPGLVDPSRRFVEKKNVGTTDQREGNEEPLKLASRHYSDWLLTDFQGNTDKTQDMCDIHDRLTSQGCTCPQEIHAGNGDVTFEVELLRDVTDSNLWSPPNIPFGWNRPDERSEQNRLASAVRSDDRE
jgi:hypothetical protein